LVEASTDSMRHPIRRPRIKYWNRWNRCIDFRWGAVDDPDHGAVAAAQAVTFVQANPETSLVSIVLE
jgi:hypothetical protein